MCSRVFHVFSPYLFWFAGTPPLFLPHDVPGLEPVESRLCVFHANSIVLYGAHHFLFILASPHWPDSALIELNYTLPVPFFRDFIPSQKEKKKERITFRRSSPLWTFDSLLGRDK